MGVYMSTCPVKPSNLLPPNTHNTLNTHNTHNTYICTLYSTRYGKSQEYYSLSRPSKPSRSFQIPSRIFQNGISSMKNVFFLGKKGGKSVDSVVVAQTQEPPEAIMRCTRYGECPPWYVYSIVSSFYVCVCYVIQTQEKLTTQPNPHFNPTNPLLHYHSCQHHSFQTTPIITYNIGTHSAVPAPPR